MTWVVSMMTNRSVVYLRMCQGRETVSISTQCTWKHHARLNESGKGRHADRENCRTSQKLFVHPPLSPPLTSPPPPPLSPVILAVPHQPRGGGHREGPL